MMNSERRKVISVHIPKTAGISLRSFYYQKFGHNKVICYYPEAGGLFRASDQVVDNHTKPILNYLRKVLLGFDSGKKVLDVLRKNRPDPKNLSFDDFPDDWSVLHGHFKPSQIPDSIREETDLVTVFRHPLERVISHYYYWLADPQRAKGADWYDSSMTLDEFILSEQMTNFQYRYIEGLKLVSFAKIGITKYLDQFINYFDPSRTGQVEKMNGNGSSSMVQPSEQAVELFIKKNKKDYALYVEAVKLTR